MHASFTTSKSSCPEVLYKKGKHLCQSLFRPKACNFIKKEALIHVFTCEFCKNFKNILFMEHVRWLLMRKQKHFPRSFRKASYNCVYAGISQKNFFQRQENYASLLNLSYAKCGYFLNKTVANFWRNVATFSYKSPNSSNKKSAGY